MQEFFLEAEGFERLGGWLIDQQSVREMGSPYLMAHGLGRPVEDAVTHFAVESEADFRLFARTRNWTAPWSKNAAGRFSLLVDGEALEEELGTEGAEWHWQYAGTVHLAPGVHTLALHDLTGFNGRCDAVYITSGENPPDDDGEGLAKVRYRLACPSDTVAEKEYDLIVAGGGIAGTCTALTAMRLGLSALLIHDREVLGGCNSSEVRVCLGGGIHCGPYPNLGNTVKEIAPVMGDPSLFEGAFYEDHRKRFAFMVHEERRGSCDLRLGWQVIDEICENGHITAVVAQNVKTSARVTFRGHLFADCTGDALLARLAGCETMYGREAKETFDETLGAPTYEKLVMGQSIRWYSYDTATEQPFPDIDFGLPFTEEDCLYVKNGDWEQESGYRRNMAEETEYIRDYGLLAIFSNWSYQKNHAARKAEYANAKLIWASHLGGKRESYRVVGDYILTQRDIEERVEHEDASAAMAWSIDLHFPEFTNEDRFGEAFRSFAYHRGINEPYPVPYRCLYARDAENLFLGGRTVSASHVAFSSLRVMRTLGMLGEVIGMAATVCRKHDCLPREVYTAHLSDLKEAMTAGVPSPDAFACGPDRGEKYHFKDAGWIRAGEPYREHPLYEKVARNIRRLGISHLKKDDDLFK